MTTRDWSAWSRESVALLQRQNDAWRSRFALDGRPYRFDLHASRLTFDREADHVEATLALVGTTSQHEGTFLWSWANDGVPRSATSRLDEVRAFGELHDLTLLVDAEWPGARAEGLEMLAVAARVLGAEGSLVHEAGPVTHYFALFDFRVVKARGDGPR